MRCVSQQRRNWNGRKGSGTRVSVTSAHVGLAPESYRQATAPPGQFSAEPTSLASSAPLGARPKAIEIVFGPEYRGSGHWRLRPERREQVGRGQFVGELNFQTVYDYSYDGTMRALEQSYQRLGMDRIDIALIHDVDTGRMDPQRPMNAGRRISVSRLLVRGFAGRFISP